MRTVHGKAFKPPEEQRDRLDQVRRIEWATIWFLVSITIAVGLVMGSSEAMRAVWVEDLVGLVPPIAYLIGSHWSEKDPTDEFPYGYRRAGLVGYLTAAVALLAFGVYISLDAIMTLINAEAPSIGTIGIGGHRVWLGWLMMVVLAYSVVPPLMLGRRKMRLAVELHQKGLYADAALNRGDWLTGLAGIGGLVGIGFGLWWADAAAACLISIEIVRDGVENLKHSVAQLMNRRPTSVTEGEKDPVLDKLENALQSLDWVKHVRVRLREDGDSLTGEVFVSTDDGADLLNKVEEATRVTQEVDWRLHDINVVPVRNGSG